MKQNKEELKDVVEKLSEEISRQMDNLYELEKRFGKRLESLTEAVIELTDAIKKGRQG